MWAIQASAPLVHGLPQHPLGEVAGAREPLKVYIHNASRFDQGQDGSQQVHMDSTGLCVVSGDYRGREPDRTQLSHFLWCQLIQKCLLVYEREWTESADQPGGELAC